MRPCPERGCPKLIGSRQRACPDHQRARDDRRPDRLRGRAGQRRREQFLRAHPVCVECEAAGVTREACEVDHTVPLEQGGPDEWDNLQSLCHDHHSAKTERERRERAAAAG